MYIPPAYKRLKRAPQVMLPKDIGIVIAYTGLNKQSKCFDAGTGSGWLAVSLARVAKEVTSYEIRDEFMKLAQKNARNEGLKNLRIMKGDPIKRIVGKDFDLVTLDMPDSDKAVPNAYKALKNGGYIFGYLPHIEQMKKFIRALGKQRFGEINAYELIARDMITRKEGTRPSTKGVWHTAYLVFARKPEVQ
ncbi:MAG: methyltransferase domain-containing protein [Candidatus Micrarchaeota archaeon]|nr:methyltransferase domain-containing protein [Candidatus Micrarchaeota archaeon]